LADAETRVRVVRVALVAPRRVVALVEAAQGQSAREGQSATADAQDKSQPAERRETGVSLRPAARRAPQDRPARCRAVAGRRALEARLDQGPAEVGRREARPRSADEPAAVVKPEVEQGAARGEARPRPVGKPDAGRAGACKREARLVRAGKRGAAGKLDAGRAEVDRQEAGLGPAVSPGNG
jgi:hypothetical protein